MLINSSIVLMGGVVSVILAVWLTPAALRPWVAIIPVTVGVLVDVLTPTSVVLLAFLFVLALWLRGDVPRWGRAPAWAEPLFAMLAVLMGFGLLPVDDPWIAMGPDPIQDQSAPFTLSVSVAMMAITILLLALHPLTHRFMDVVRAIRLGVSTGFLISIPVLSADYVMGGIDWNPGFPDSEYLVLWLMGQVFVVSMEESFFRGFLQRRFAQAMPLWGAIALTSLLFGLAHFGGGWMWIVGATIAGIGYGWIYERSGRRLESAMAAHATLNAIHLGLFSYPNL